MLVALISTSGAPGVSTTAIGMTLTAPVAHTLLVEADPAGYSPTLAGYWQSNVPHSHSLINLVEADREGRLPEALHTQIMSLRPPTPTDTASVLPGLMNAAQAEAMRRTWDPLGNRLSTMARDQTNLGVIIDAGRFSPYSGQLDLIRHSDVIAIMTRPTLTAAVAVRSALVPLRRALAASRSNASLGLILVGDAPPFGGYPARDFVAGVGIDVISEIPWTPSHAAIFSANSPLPRWSMKRSLYLRKISHLWPAIEAHYESHQPDWVMTQGAAGGVRV